MVGKALTDHPSFWNILEPEATERYICYNVPPCQLFSIIKPILKWFSMISLEYFKICLFNFKQTEILRLTTWHMRCWWNVRKWKLISERVMSLFTNRGQACVMRNNWGTSILLFRYLHHWSHLSCNICFSNISLWLKLHLKGNTFDITAFYKAEVFQTATVLLEDWWNRSHSICVRSRFDSRAISVILYKAARQCCSHITGCACSSVVGCWWPLIPSSFLCYLQG